MNDETKKAGDAGGRVACEAQARYAAIRKPG